MSLQRQIISLLSEQPRTYIDLSKRLWQAGFLVDYNQPRCCLYLAVATQRQKERKGVLRRQTRRTGQFEYRVTLPGQADEEHIEAKLHDGVLTVRVPKAQSAQARRIEVKAA